MRPAFRLALLVSVAALAACSDATGPRPAMKAPRADVIDSTSLTGAERCNVQQGSSTRC
jgi:hypothetical protein